MEGLSFVRIRNGLLAMLTLVGSPTALAAATVLLVIDPQLPDDVPHAVQSHLAVSRPDLQVIVSTREEVASIASSARPLVAVSFGAAAAGTVRTRLAGTPQLHLLLTRDAHAALPPATAAASAIFIDQPASRQIAMLERALPGWPLAIVSSPGSAAMAEALAQAARERGLQVKTLQIRSATEWHTALEHILREPAALIALPDPALYNSHTIRNILLASYRHRAPLAGFSPAYLRAGALIALYATPEQLARQAAHAIERMLLGEAPPTAGFSSEVEVGINTHVARSLGIASDAPERIARDVLAAEQGDAP